MNWFRIVRLVAVSFLVMSCGDDELKRNFDDMESLANEARESRDSLQTVADSLGSKVYVLRDSVSSLNLRIHSLKSDSTHLSLQIKDMSKKSPQEKGKKEKPMVKTLIVVTPDTTGKKSASIFEPTVTPDSLVSPDTSSFIGYIWEKRNKFEP
ncbi:MAG: hypothetical protein Q8Q95_04170 [bacterium]|nr:hypothetical protein [bacterium]